MYIISSKLNSAFSAIGKATADKITAKLVGKTHACLAFAFAWIINLNMRSCSESVCVILNIHFCAYRASSYEPRQPGWLGFRDLASRSFLCKNIDVFIWEADLGNRDENFPIWTPRMNTPAQWPGRNLLNKIASLPQHRGQQSGIVLIFNVFPL